MVNYPEEKSGEENRQAAGQAGKEKNNGNVFYLTSLT